MTAYYANVLPEFTERAIEHLSHLLRPAIRVEDFDTEKKVILEEIAMYLDDPGHRLYEKLMEAHFGNHPLSMSVLGSAESIQKARARPDGASISASATGRATWCLSATGRLDFEEIVELAEKYCGAWPHVDAPRQQPQPIYKPQHIAMTDAKLNRQYTMGMTPGPSAQDDRRFAARVLADVIGDADGSRFYWALVDNAIAEDADFGFYPHDALRLVLHRPDHRTRAHRAGDGHRDEGAGEGQDRPERRRGRAGQEQDRQQPGPVAARFPSAACAASAASGSTTASTARSNRTWRPCWPWTAPRWNSSCGISRSTR